MLGFGGVGVDHSIASFLTFLSFFSIFRPVSSSLRSFRDMPCNLFHRSLLPSVLLS